MFTQGKKGEKKLDAKFSDDDICQCGGQSNAAIFSRLNFPIDTVRQTSEHLHVHYTHTAVKKRMTVNQNIYTNTRVRLGCPGDVVLTCSSNITAHESVQVNKPESVSCYN